MRRTLVSLLSVLAFVAFSGSAMAGSGCGSYGGETAGGHSTQTSTVTADASGGQTSTPVPTKSQN